MYYSLLTIESKEPRSRLVRATHRRQACAEIHAYDTPARAHTSRLNPLQTSRGSHPPREMVRFSFSRCEGKRVRGSTHFGRVQFHAIRPRCLCPLDRSMTPIGDAPIEHSATISSTMSQCVSIATSSPLWYRCCCFRTSYSIFERLRPPVG